MRQELDSKILDLDRQGIVPGPGETEEAFLERAGYCLALKERLWDELGEGIPFKEGDAATKEALQAALTKTEELYGISPAWVPLFFSDYQLNLWQGGCAWIFQATEESPKAALLQLRAKFKNSKTYLRVYDRSELIAHELSHVGRLAFEEPKFEEFFAYRSADSWFRRVFGPIVKSSLESLMFVILLLLILVIDVSLMATGKVEFYAMAMWVKMIPLAAVIAALGRLWMRHRQLARCTAMLMLLTRDSRKAEAALYRLTDEEIIAFGRLSLKEIKEYSKEQGSAELRWRVINTLFAGWRCPG